MSEKVYGVGVVGLGMGHSCCRWVADAPGVKLAAVCDLDEERLKRTCEEFNVPGEKDYAKFLERADVEIAYVMTPSGLHAKLGVRAAQKGKHVLVSKPMDVSLEHCDQLLAACEKAGVLCGVDFNGRFADLQQQIRHAIDTGLFGKLILGEARLKWFRSDEYYARGGWRGTWAMDGGGSLANQTIHQIDQLQWFMGPLDAVCAAEVGIFNHEKIETEDLGVALLRFKSGALGTILGTTTFPRNQYAGLEIHGGEGGVLAMRGDPTWVFQDETRLQKLKRASEVRTSVEDFALVLNGKKEKLTCDGIEGRKSIELLTAVYRSAKEHREVKLPL